MTAITFTPPPHLMEQIEAEAATKGLSVAQLLTAILEAAARNTERKGEA